MKIKVDQAKCIGCGACVATCPKCFEMDGAVSKVKKDDCECKDISVKAVAEACPAEAISVE